jgi:hypothetical protein
MIKDPQVGTFLDVSNVHLTEDEMAFLMDERSEWTIYPYAEGAFVYVPRHPEGLKAELENLEGSGKLRKEIVDLFRWAAKKGYWFVRFDADGMVYPELPQFVW